MPQEWTAIQRIADTVIPATGTGDFLFLIMTNFNLKLLHFIIKREIKKTLIRVFQHPYIYNATKKANKETMAQMRKKKKIIKMGKRTVLCICIRGADSLYFFRWMYMLLFSQCPSCC